MSRLMAFITVVVIWVFIMAMMFASFIVTGSKEIFIIAAITSLLMGLVAYVQDRELKRIQDK